MNRFILSSIYHKNNLYSNFISSDNYYLFSKKNPLNSLLILQQSSTKSYNQKKFIICIMLMEYLIKMNTLQHRTSLVYTKNVMSNRKISIGYWLNNDNIYRFIDFFFTDLYWNMKPYTFKSKDWCLFNINIYKHIIYKFKKMLELTSLVKNKIRFEPYLLKKKYNFKICFLGYHYIYYTWWTKNLGIPTII